MTLWHRIKRLFRWRCPYADQTCRQMDMCRKCRRDDA